MSTTPNDPIPSESPIRDLRPPRSEASPTGSEPGANPFGRSTPTPPAGPGQVPPPRSGTAGVFAPAAPNPQYPDQGSGLGSGYPPAPPGSTSQPPGPGNQPGGSDGSNVLRINVPQDPFAGTDPAQGRPLSELAPLPLPGPNNAQSAQQSVRIGIWGSTRSGKSTYLAALPIAAMQAQNGTWMVSGSDDVAAEYLNHSVQWLAAERRFPRANRMTETISWRFHGTPPNNWLANRGLMSRRRSNPVEFTLELHDPKGLDYDARSLNEATIGHLVNANGLLYLMDPEVSADGTDLNFQAFFAALQLLTTRMSASGQLHRGRLPHYLAVCVTKFDDERFFRTLVQNTDLVTQDRDGPKLPRVPQERAEEFFNWVCDRVLRSNSGMIREALRAFFHPERIAYFATSAIGFRLNQNGVFDFRDFNNVQTINDLRGLRDRPRPINVLEPLVFLEQRIRADRR